MKRLLFNQAPEDGNGPQVTDQAPPTPPPSQRPPPAASTVLNAEITEETLQLRTKLDESERSRKKLETDYAALADENHRLKSAGLTAPKDDRSDLEKFMAGEDV